MFLNPKPFVVSQLSVSQLELLNRCARRWWFDRVCHIKEGETAAKSAGTGSHALLEHTVTKGEDVLGPMEAPARPYLPRPGEQVFCEWGFDDKPRIPGQYWHDAKSSLLKVDGVPFIGFIDLWHATGLFVDSDGARKREQPNTAEAVDYKTTSSIQRNAKAGFQLPRTIQMSGYGAWLAARVPGVRWVRLSHVYIQTKGAPREASGRCRSCGAEIVWARLKGKRHPFDAVADNRNLPKGGRFVLFLRGGEVTASHVAGVPPKMAGWDRFTSHFATCPNAAEHRRGG